MKCKFTDVQCLVRGTTGLKLSDSASIFQSSPASPTPLTPSPCTTTDGLQLQKHQSYINYSGLGSLGFALKL